MAETHIDYDKLVQDALRGVVKDILRRVASEGLPGSHHFYVAFRTRAPGVDIPASLRKRYPDEMTIVLQHRFWGLEVHEDYFEIGLSFNQRPERLVIPFSAVIGFVDPSVQFALQFQEPAAEQEAAPAEPQAPALAEPEAEAETGVDAEAAAEEAGDNVVTLDAFRKKP